MSHQISRKHLVAHAVECSTYGAHLTWTVSDDGVLTISGIGSMESDEYEDVP